jgi:hypothetical protein
MNVILNCPFEGAHQRLFFYRIGKYAVVSLSLSSVFSVVFFQTTATPVRFSNRRSHDFEILSHLHPQIKPQY